MIIHKPLETGESHKLVTSTAALCFQTTLQDELIDLHVLKRYCVSHTTLTTKLECYVQEKDQPV